jgi:prophage antirepressor-like protein
MGNQLQIFNNEEFGQVRSIRLKGKDYFVANDIAKALGYISPKDAITRHCKGATKVSYLTEGGNQEVKFIPEGDIFRLVSRSKLPNAEKFECWIFDDLLPTLRRTGKYELHNEEDEKSQTELEQIATNIFGQLDTKITKLDEYYRPRHKTKLGLNKFIKDCLGDNATTENCKKAKNTLLTLLGNYSIYEEVPIDRLQDTNTIARLYDICKNINNSIVGGIQ